MKNFYLGITHGQLELEDKIRSFSLVKGTCYYFFLMSKSSPEKKKRR